MTRRRTLFGAFALALATLGLTSSVSAQYRPPEPPQLPFPPPGAAPPATAGALTAADGRRIGWSWEPGLVLDTGWEQNIGFARPEGPDDFFGALRASMARVRRGPRSDFRLRITGAGYIYREESNQNRADAFVDLSTRGPSRRGSTDA